MLNFGNLGGTLYSADTPLCTFKYVNGHFDKSAVHILCDDEKLRPFLIDNYLCAREWQIFFEEQVTPITRQGLLQDLAATTPIRSYIPEQILRYTSCRNLANNHWVKCDNDLSCWEPWQIEDMKKRGIIQ